MSPLSWSKPPLDYIEFYETSEKQQYLNKPQVGKSKQNYIAEYDWNTHIFTVKKLTTYEKWPIM